MEALIIVGEVVVSFVAIIVLVGAIGKLAQKISGRE